MSEKTTDLAHELWAMAQLAPGEHLYFLKAPSLPDGFRMAAERIKSGEERIRELERENSALRNAAPNGLPELLLRLQQADELEAENAKLREALVIWEKYDRESPDRTPAPDYGLKRILHGEARKATEKALAGEEEG